MAKTTRSRHNGRKQQAQLLPVYDGHGHAEKHQRDQFRSPGIVGGGAAQRDRQDGQQQHDIQPDNAGQGPRCRYRIYTPHRRNSENATKVIVSARSNRLFKRPAGTVFHILALKQANGFGIQRLATLGQHRSSGHVLDRSRLHCRDGLFQGFAAAMLVES